jgi:hypothetical protein
MRLTALWTTRSASPVFGLSPMAVGRPPT